MTPETNVILIKRGMDCNVSVFLHAEYYVSLGIRFRKSQICDFRAGASMSVH